MSPDMSPELEVLDQLLGGDLPLRLIRRIVDDDARFVEAVLALLRSGDVCLLGPDGNAVPSRQWRDELTAAISDGDADSHRLDITAQGVQRVA
jgi:hypothetical protein